MAVLVPAVGKLWKSAATPTLHIDMSAEYLFARHGTAVWQPAPAAAASVSRPAAFTFTQGQAAAGGQLPVRRSCFTPLSAAD